MDKLGIIIVVIAITLFSCVYFAPMNTPTCSNQVITNEPETTMVTQNYLSTPYLANPNNLDGPIQELQIIQMDENTDKEVN